MVNEMNIPLSVYEMVLAIWLGGGVLLYAFWCLWRDTGPVVVDEPQRTFPGALLWPLFLVLMIMNAIWCGLEAIASYFTFSFRYLYERFRNR